VKNNILRKKNITIFLILLIIFYYPFFAHENNDQIQATKIDSNTLGYFQSTTCKISLHEVLVKNFNNNANIYFNNNDYVGTECFGKVTGLDLVNEKYIVSIGSNTTISFLLQTVVWLILLFILFKKRTEKIKISYFPIIPLSLLLTFQHLTEARFYENSNKYFKTELLAGNYYLLNYLLSYLIVGFFIKEIYELKEINLTSLIPYMYLFIGTYVGMNMNAYLIFFSFFGLLSIRLLKINSTFLYFYIFLSGVWVFFKSPTNDYFDTDKLRGFISSSNSRGSTIFWILLIYLSIEGIIYLTKNSSFNLIKLKDNFLISGGLITLFGVLGAYFPVVNFFNFFIFGQQKRGMKNFEVVAGNTWRGFAPSAEFIGEFLAISLIICVYTYKKFPSSFKNIDLILILLCVFSLFKSNNFAAMSSMTLIIVFILSTKFLKTHLKYLLIVLTIFFLVSGFLISNDYKSKNHVLVDEALLHSDLFQYSDNYINYLQTKPYLDSKDYNSLLLVNNNDERVSSSLLFLVNTYTQSFNLPLVPNFTGLLGYTSLIINRTELWGIAIAKYDPNNIQVLFGYGPQQFLNYFNDHNIRLDVPDYRLSSLFLPHSSLFNVLLFYGVFGIIIFVFFLLKKIYHRNFNKNIFGVILIFLLINLLKSDSILYLSTFTLLCYLFEKVFEFNNEI